MKTKQEAINWINNSIDKQYDEDKYYGFQCFDYSNAYYKFVTGNKLYGYGAKDIPFANDFTGVATVYKNTPTFLAQAGDIVVWGSSFGNGWGHTAVVLDATLEFIIVVEQNWLNGGWTDGIEKGGKGWEKATKRRHDYSTDMWFVRPNFKTSVVTKAKNTVQKVAKKVTTKKLKILLVAGHGQGYWSNDSGAVGNGFNERDFIRTNIVPNVAKYLKMAGHKVEYYGGNNMSQDLFQDTRYGLEIDPTNYYKYGMYWVSKQKYDVVVEFHLDSAGATAKGGHVIIAKGLDADSIDLGIQAVIKKHLGLIRTIDKRDNLLNVNVAKAQNVNYRLVELGFISSARDMNYINKHLDEFTHNLAEAIHGSEIKANVNIKSKTKRILYTVKDGDTIWGIATKYKVNPESIIKLNGIKNNLIRVGQKIVIEVS